MWKRIVGLLAALAFAVSIGACKKDETVKPKPTPSKTKAPAKTKAPDEGTTQPKTPE